MGARNNAPNQNPFALLSAAEDYGILGRARKPEPLRKVP
jgi:hypothetical protein